jgi:predicted O-methyltransferase YrrM
MSILFSFPFNQISEAQKELLGVLLGGRDISVGVELGSWVGESASVISKHCKKLYCVDLWKGNEGTEIGIKAKTNDIKSIFLGNMKELGIENIDVITSDTSEAARGFEDGSVDFVYIDACHLYSGVKKDLDAWVPKVRKGGLIAGHDFAGTYFDEKCTEFNCVGGIHHGVVKAVLERFPDVKFDKEIWWKEL